MYYSAFSFVIEKYHVHANLYRIFHDIIPQLLTKPVSVSEIYHECLATTEQAST